MHILMTGGTGFIGESLANSLLSEGHRVTILSRKPRRDGGLCRYVLSLDALDADAPVDAIINLAGASLADKRWTAAYKRELLRSRVETTRDLIDFIARSATRPEVLLSASAIGFYGPQGAHALTESDPAGEGFAAELCRQWEETALRAEEYGLRVCLMRLGVVLDKGQGAFQELERPFRFGLANWVGNGHQYLSWIHRSDAVAAIRYLLADGEARGAWNLTAPAPVTGREFCEAMKHQHRTLLTQAVPGWVLRLALGEMANELLLQGQRVMPDKLQAAGFQFQAETIERALGKIYAG